MRTGGLLGIVRAFLGDAIRGFGLRVAKISRAVGNVIDPPTPERIDPAPEYERRLWDRDQDARARTKELP